MTTEEALVEAMMKDLDDLGPIAVYADWLGENDRYEDEANVRLAITALEIVAGFDRLAGTKDGWAVLKELLGDLPRIIREAEPPPGPGEWDHTRVMAEDDEAALAGWFQPLRGTYFGYFSKPTPLHEMRTAALHLLRSAVHVEGTWLDFGEGPIVRFGGWRNYMNTYTSVSREEMIANVRRIMGRGQSEADKKP